VARCNRPDCGRGEIDYQGFCLACSRRPLPSLAPRGDGKAPHRPPLPAPEAARARPEPWWGLDLVAAGPVPTAPDEDEAVATDATIPEERRFCANPECGRPVGRGRDGSPGLVKGFCPACRHPFDFTRSRVGQVVAGRYEVKGELGQGGYATALLARDRSLSTDVVLKDLSESVAATARRERDALVGLRHDSIVRIYGYEDSKPEGRYLVLEYVRGTPLSKPAGDRLEVVLAQGLQILHALDYLHSRGLLHMDVKPANIVRFAEQGAGGPRDRVRLIDFGAVRTLGDTEPVGPSTPAYAPPRGDGKADPEYSFPAGPTAGFDLFCLGSTLQQLCHRHLSGPGARSLELLLRRATDVDQPERRFRSARQFAEQLSGVIRQVVAAAPGGRRIIQPSALFESMPEPLHGELGVPRPLGHWIGARVSADGRIAMAAPFGPPAPTDVVAALPAPVADPYDPDMTRACEPELAACRTALRNGDLDAAARCLRDTHLPGWSWIRAWYTGLIALADRNPGGAFDHFDIVRAALPGELIPELALGLSAELAGDAAQAHERYHAVFGTAPALGAAGFGLARTHLLAGRRAEAVVAAQRLAREFQAQELRFEHEARIAVVRLLVAVTESSVPAETDLDKAQELLDQLPESIGPQARILLNAEIQYGRSAVTDSWLPLSEMVRDLAKLAITRPDFVKVTDLANQLRPPVQWWWQHGFTKVRDRRPREHMMT
jgi:serine/threonine-protein kinase PknG